MERPSDTALHGPRPGLTLTLMILAAVLMLAGGVWLARRTVNQRIPADRALLRECAGELQGELARLDMLYDRHLQRLAKMLENNMVMDEVRERARDVEGIAQISVLVLRGQSDHVRTSTRGTPPPEPELIIEGGKTSPFAAGLSREMVFAVNDSNQPDPGEGWQEESGGVWMFWWKRLDGQRAAVFAIRSAEVKTAINGHLEDLLKRIWAPVRAAGGLDRMEGPGSRLLAGIAAAPEPLPDFTIPLTSRMGDWHIVSWDRWETVTEWDLPTLAIAGTLAVGLVLLGWTVAGAQRRALREVTARVSFVNRVSHELGAPLTNLNLYLELAREALPAEAEESERRLAVAQEETGRLSRLVENVLTFARGERKRLTLRPVSCRPAEIVAAVMERFAPALARRHITVEAALDDDTAATLDADAFGQITANLISNVEKYAATGGWMRVTLELTGEDLVLRVSDRGPGIPEAARERIFLPFERLDSRLTEGVSGTGLGLAICRDLAARMGGAVTVLNHAEQDGCTFTVRIPATRAAEAAGQGQEPHDAEAGKLAVVPAPGAS